MRRTIARVFLSALIVLLPLSSWAEGAMRILECNIDKLCDKDGVCTTDSGAVTFTMEPQNLDAEGAGSYIISYGTTTSAMHARSFAGPFLWNPDQTMHTLLANSETRFLWHRLFLSPAPNSTIQFLSCAFTQ